MARLSDLMRGERTVHLIYAGEDVAVTYRPAGITAEFQSKLREISEEPTRSGEKTAELLAGILTGWDVLEDDGNAVAITVERLRRLALDFLAEISLAIFSDIQPGTADEKK